MTAQSVPRAKAERLAEQLASYPIGTSRRTGQRFYIVPASNRLAAHWTALDGSGCTCRGYQYRGTCAHATAARLLAERQQQPAPSTRPAPRRTYEDLFPACKGGCGDIGERDGYCDRCASDREYRQRLEARRADPNAGASPRCAGPLQVGARLAAELPPFRLNELAE